jgi:hypothetical protein
MHRRRTVVYDGNVEIIYSYIGKVRKVLVYVNFVSEGQLTRPPAVVFGDVVAGGKNL